MQQSCPPADNRLGPRTVRVLALQLVLWTVCAGLVPPIHDFDGVLGLTGRTASQVELFLQLLVGQNLQKLSVPWSNPFYFHSTFSMS